jgi:hypothetical protein
MQDGGWSQAFSELAASAVRALVRLWKQDIVQVGLAIGMFLALALPLLIVIALLWYVESSGWRPAGGFYKIGRLSGATSPDAQAREATMDVRVITVAARPNATAATPIEVRARAPAA